MNRLFLLAAALLAACDHGTRAPQQCLLEWAIKSVHCTHAGAADIERYVRVVRRLRDVGYSTVAVVTDHGFLHWEPEKDEVDDPPTGEVLWRSRRAVVGKRYPKVNEYACTPGENRSSSKACEAVVFASTV